MQIKLILVGKTNEAYLREGEAIYTDRLKHYVKFKEEVIPELKKASKLSVEQIKTQEGILILEKLEKSDRVILLDEKGKTFSSETFAKWTQKKLNTGLKQLVFIIGGAYGFSDQVYQRADEKIALSEMTFSHQMIRLLFKEQLYRSYTILNNQPYHHR